MPVKSRKLDKRIIGINLVHFLVLTLLVLVSFIGLFAIKSPSWLNPSANSNSQEKINIFVEEFDGNILNVYATHSKISDTETLDPYIDDDNLTLSVDENISYTKIKPSTTTLAFRYRESFDSNSDLIIADSKAESVKILKYKIPSDSKKFRIEKSIKPGDIKALTAESYYVKDLLTIGKFTAGASFNPYYTTIFTNTENRARDKSLDIFIVGLCYESDMQAYNSLAESVKNKIIEGDYFNVNKNRFNIHKVSNVFDKSTYGCDMTGATATRISNVLKPVGAETLIVLVNNTASISYGYYATSTYLGTAYISRKIALLDQLVLHELGHSIGGLRDEYINMSGSNAFVSLNDKMTAFTSPNDFKNCETSCSLFNSKYNSANECSLGCGYSTGLYRTTKTSIMKNWSGTFNAISKDALDYNIQKFAPKTVSFITPTNTLPTAVITPKPTISPVSFAEGIQATLKTPSNNAVVSFPIFISWNPAKDVKRYVLWIGSSVGKNDIYGISTSGSTYSVIVEKGKLWTTVKTNDKLYLKLMTETKSSGWKHIDYVLKIK